MKKILILMLCAILLCAMPLVASAEETTPPESVETEETTPGTEETPPAEEVPPTEETPPEDVAPPVDEPTEDVPEEPELTLPEKIVDFITTNYDSSALIGFAITLIAYVIFGIQQFKNIGGKLGIFNNNVVKVAEDSSKAIDASFVEVKGIAENSIGVVNKVLDEAKEIMQAISEGNTTALADVLGKVESLSTTFVSAILESNKVMEACKQAALENANMMAELLMLANIPNSKKEELYARHLSVMKAIADAEKSEVATDDGKET